MIPLGMTRGKESHVLAIETDQFFPINTEIWLTKSRSEFIGKLVD
jgi:hypothetical protein